MLFFFFSNATATTEIYTLSLHDALPIFLYDLNTGSAFNIGNVAQYAFDYTGTSLAWIVDADADRKSTRLNSSHSSISYAVFCLKKKKNTNTDTPISPVYYPILYCVHYVV